MRAVPPENGYDGPARVFFGHTVFDEPRVSDTAVGLDTGCVYGGSLTAYEYWSDDLVSVPAEETYQSRAASKIL